MATDLCVSNHDMAMSLADLLVVTERPDMPDRGDPICWYALLDMSAFKSVGEAEAWIRPISDPMHSWFNLYADMDGLLLSSQGPRLVRLRDEGRFSTFLVAPELFLGLGLLAVSSKTDDLESHLLRLREVLLPDGTAALFRFQDPRVLAGLMPLLDATQMRALLGPAERWCCFDPCGRPYAISNDFRGRPAAPFRLRPEQLAAIDAALLPYEVISQTQEVDATLLAGLNPCERLIMARERISEARDRGLSMPNDVSLFCVLSFQLPDGFADETPFNHAIGYARDGRGSFSDALDRADPRAWEKWNEVLAHQDGM